LGKKAELTSVKPPVALKVKSLENFARLTLALTDSPPIVWFFKHKGKKYLATFSVYLSWKGDIPLLTYVSLKGKPGPFLAYKSDGAKEEYEFTDNIENPRYVYAPIIVLKEIYDFLKAPVEGKFPEPSKPVKMEVDGLNSLLRLLYLISIREGSLFPLWYFKSNGRRILGVCVPFEHYYEANALPVFFYVRLRRKPPAPFIRYSTSIMKGENIDFSPNTSDTKYFYAKIIEVEGMPLFPD